MRYVRNYQKKDFDAVNQILQEAFSLQKECSLKNSSFCELVAVDEDVIIGYLLLTTVIDPVLNSYRFLVDYVCVKKQFQHQGVGRLLMEKAEEIARGKRAYCMELTSNSSRVYAHRLYESCGFKKRDTNIFRKDLL